MGRDRGLRRFLQRFQRRLLKQQLVEVSTQCCDRPDPLGRDQLPKALGKGSTLRITDPLCEHFLELIDQQHKSSVWRMIRMALPLGVLRDTRERADDRSHRCDAATFQIVGEAVRSRIIAVRQFG